MEKVTGKLEELNLGATAPLKQKPGTLGTPTQIATNAIKLSFAKNLAIYKYDVNIDEIYMKNNIEVSKSLTKGPRNDTEQTRRISKATKALKVVFNKSNALKNAELFYDKSSSLYSFSKFSKIDENVEASAVTKNKDCERIHVVISPVKESFQVSTNDLPKTVNSKFGTADKTFLEAVNVIISGVYDKDEQKQITYKGVHYIYDAETAGFKDLPILPCAQYAGVGIGESVKCLEGNGDGPSLYCISDVKKSAFHVDYQNLFEKFSEILRERGLRMSDSLTSVSQEAMILKRLTKGLVVRFSYGAEHVKGNDGKIITIGGFGECASKKTFDFNGKTITVAEYFRIKYGRKLAYPNFFTVYDAKKKDALFPVECLMVAENQRVKIEHQTDRGQQNMIKASAVAPDIRQNQTIKLNKAFGLENSNRSLNSVGMTIDSQSVVVPGRIMPQALINAGGKQMEARGNSWAAHAYIKPAQFPKWIVAGVCTRINIPGYIQRIQDRAMQCRMKWTNPIQKDLASAGQIEKMMIEAKAEKVEYVMFICRDSLNIHGEIKVLEQKYGIITQEIRETKASDVLLKGQPQTVQNVLHKINLKLGGANWKVEGYANKGTNFLGNGRLFFGFESSRSLGGEAVAVGYSANVCSASNQNFIGGFKFAKQSDDIYGQVIGSVVKEYVLKAKENWKAPPSHLYFYFNGVSEGQFTLIANKYVDIIKSTCQELNANYKPNITVFAVSKMHLERLYRQKITGVKVAEKNITPGTVVDSVIVSPVYNEFYLNSHSAFQGSAKTPKFSHIFDTTKMSMNEHEGIAHQLCHLMGIVTSTVSLPAPIMVADRCAKRASKLFGQKSTDGSVFSGGSGPVDIEKLNEEFQYDEHLSNVRYNA